MLYLIRFHLLYSVLNVFGARGGLKFLERSVGYHKYRTVNLYSLTPSMRSGYVFVFFLSLRAYIYSSDLITGSHSHRTTCNYNLYLSFRLETKFEHQMHNVMQYLTIISNSSEMIT